MAHVRVVANRHIESNMELGALKFISTEGVAHADAQGHFSLELSVGDYSLKVGSSASNKNDQRVSIDEGAVVHWDGFVDTGLCLTGQVALPQPDGQAKDEPDAPQFVLEASVYARGGLWVGVTTTIDGGFFLLPRCPANHMAVDFSQREGGELLHHEASATAGMEGWRISMEGNQLTKVSWRPLDDGAGAPCATELLVWDAEGKRGRQRHMGGRVGEEASIMLPEGA